MFEWELQVMKHLNDADMIAIQAVSSAEGLTPDQASALLRELRIAADAYRQVVRTAAVRLNSLEGDDSVNVILEEGLAEVPPELQEPEGSE